MFTIFGRVKEVYKDEGFMGLIKATVRFVHDILLLLYSRMKRKDFIEMEYFPRDAEGAFNLSQRNSLWFFKSRQKSEFLELLKIFEKRNLHNIMEIGTYKG